MARPRKEGDNPDGPYAQVTWLGEKGGPAETTCYGKEFTVGEAVEVTDQRTIDKAKANPFFKVEE